MVMQKAVLSNVIKILIVLPLVFSTSCRKSSGGEGEVPPSDTGGSGMTTNMDQAPNQEISSSVIFDFLWKPQSERNGLLVVLVNPANVQVRVAGAISEDLLDSGPSNGRGTTARGRFSGCAYGTNVTVEFFDARNRKILIADGRESVTIPNGCDRVEFRL